MHHPDVFFHSFCMFGWLSPDSHGLWLVCGHLPPLVLYSNHEFLALGKLVLVSWVMSVLHSLLESLMLLWLSFCTALEIPHFFCQLRQMVQSACSDKFLNSMVMYFATGLPGDISVVGILYCYSKVVSSVLGISSAHGKYKAFSTCASHLSVVSLFYCMSLGVYFNSVATHSSHCCYPQLTFKCNSLGDIHCGYTHAEPLNLQSKEKRHKGGSEKFIWKENFKRDIFLRVKKCHDCSDQTLRLRIYNTLMRLCV